MAGPAVLVVREERVGSVQPLHEPRKVGPRRPCQEMEVVVHQGESVEHDGRRKHAVRELAEEPLPIVIRPKDLLPAVAAAGDVVQGVGEVDSGRSCHDLKRISRWISAVKAS